MCFQRKTHRTEMFPNENLLFRTVFISFQFRTVFISFQSFRGTRNVVLNTSWKLTARNPFFRTGLFSWCNPVEIILYSTISAQKAPSTNHQSTLIPLRLPSFHIPENPPIFASKKNTRCFPFKISRPFCFVSQPPQQGFRFAVHQLVCGVPCVFFSERPLSSIFGVAPSAPELLRKNFTVRKEQVPRGIPRSKEKKSKVVSTHLWNTPLNLYQ